jgi:hypothetical protein
VVQEDTREVESVVLVNLRVEQVSILHLSIPIHHVGGFLDLFIHSSKRTTAGTGRVDRRTIGTGAGNAIGPIWGVQKRLFGTGARVPCRYEFARLLFDHVSERAQGGTEGLGRHRGPREAQRGNAQTQNMDFINKVGKLKYFSRTFSDCMVYPGR